VPPCRELRLRHRDRYGFTYYTVHEPYLDTFAPVIDRVRSMEEQGRGKD
jgi:hypothetical protein